MTRFFKCRWEETREDKYDHWGFSNWYFEVETTGYPVRQIIKYDNGRMLRYDASLLDDEFGGLADQPLDLDEDGFFEITSAEFEKEWAQ